MSGSAILKPSVACIASPLPDEVRADFNDAFDMAFFAPDYPVGALADHAPEVLLVTVDVPLGTDEIAALPPSVRAIGTYSVGLDHIDLDAAAARKLAVFNTPDVLTDSVAEAALFLLLGAARRGTESIDLLRGRRWPGWNARQLNGVELQGKRLGIFGMGSIGRGIARRAQGLGMTICYSNRSRLSADIEAPLRATYVAEPLQMLKEIDALVLAAPSTPQTRGFLDDAALERAKFGLLVVNIARGDLVVDDALINALTSGRVRAAGLDVFNGEPSIDKRYYDLPNVFMTPHIGSSTIEARRRMGVALVDGIAAWRAGERPPNQHL